MVEDGKKMGASALIFLVWEYAYETRSTCTTAKRGILPLINIPFAH